MKVEALTGPALVKALPDVARLRIGVFRDFPYLYDGNLAYEANYLQTYRDSPQAIIVGASHNNQLVGVSTGTPLLESADDFSNALKGTGIDLREVFYCAESVLLPQYRGRGLGHRFFEVREAHARAHGFRYCCFCSVIRPADHPARPAGYRPLDPFWRARGYAPLPGAVARFDWTDLGDTKPSTKSLQVWIRAL